jgi:homogentisate 1,2-dioxygenase
MESFVKYRKGQVPQRVHADLNGLKDDELGRNGFFGRQALLYRRHDPTVFRAQGPLHERHTPTAGILPADHGDPRGDPMLLYSNADVKVSLSRRAEPMPFFAANVDGDLVLFTHRGEGTVETEFGPLRYRPGEYVYLPKATVYRVVPDDTDTFMLVIDSAEELRVPPPTLLGRHFPYDSSMITVPEPDPQDDDGRESYEIRLNHGEGEHTSLFCAHTPLDVAGWRGDNFPFSLNIADYNVITSESVHLPPSVHVFLNTPNVWIVHFLPRAAETRPGTERTPWYHRNTDFDELAFYHGGSVFGITMPPALLSHAPQGIHHGAPERARERARRLHDEVSRVEWEVINIDTRHRLTPSPALLALEAAAERAAAAARPEPVRPEPAGRP